MTSASARGTFVDAHSAEESRREPERVDNVDVELFRESRRIDAEFGTSDVEKRTRRRIAPDSALCTTPASSYNESPDVANAVEFGSSRPWRKRRIVACLLSLGEDSTARSVASCGNGGRQCGRPRLCSFCSSIPGGRAQRRHGERVREWDRYLWFALHGDRAYSTPAAARESVVDSLTKLKRRRFDVGDDWLRMLDDGFAREIRREYVADGRAVPFRTLIPQGLAGVHVTQSGAGGFRAHLDVFCAGRWMDSDELVRKWRSCGGGNIANPIRPRIRDGRLDDDGEKPPVVTGERVESDLREDRREYAETVDKVLAYVTETTEIQSPESAVAYAIDVSGKPTVSTWGL